MKIEEAIAAYNSINSTNNKTKATDFTSSGFSDIYSKVLNGTDSQAIRTQTNSYEEIFEKASKEYGVPINLLKAVAKAESGFNAKAVSSCGAQGIMQLMPKTAEALGVVDSFNPEQNIMGGAKYLSQMLDNYNGDTTLALAAYNAGAGNVKKYGGVPPFKETQNYISKVLGYAGENTNVSQSQSLEQLAEKISLGDDTDEEFLTSMVLLNLMELRNKANSIGRLSEEEEA